MTKQEFYPLFTKLRNAYRYSDLKDEQIDWYFEELRYWSLNKMEQVIKKAVRTEKSFPSIAALIAIGEEFKENVTNDLKIEKQCSYCRDGFLYANYFDAFYKMSREVGFICHMCFGKSGFAQKYSKTIPVWNNQKGYELIPITHELDFTKPKFLQKREIKEPELEEVYNF